MLRVKWQQVLLILIVGAIMLAVPAISFGANVTIRVEKHTNTGFNSAANPTLQANPTLLIPEIVVSSAPSPATQPVLHKLLTCATRPCTATNLGGSGITVKDNNSTSHCRLEKNDGSSLGRFELKGCIIEVPNGGTAANLRIVAINEPGAFATRMGGSRSYSLAFNGSFRTFTGINTTDNFVRATSCANAAAGSTFCMRVSVTANADGSDPNGPNTVNFNPAETAATISVDNSTSGFTSGGTGAFALTDGEGPAFNANSAGIPCGTSGVANTCRPVVRSDYRIVINPGTRLRITSSGSVGFGLEPDENFGFLPVVTEFLGPEAGFANRWFAYAPAAPGLYDCTAMPPLTNQTKNSTEANIPMKFNCSQGTATTPTNVPLVVQFDPSLPPVQQASLSSSGLFFTPISARKFGDVTSLVYNYTIPADKDCTGGSMRVAFGLGASPSQATEEAIFLLGSSSDFLSNCSGAVDDLSGQNLFQNTELRAFDPSRQIGSECCYPLSQVQTRNKNDFLVYVALIVDGQLDGSPVGHDQKLDVTPVGTTNVGASISFKGKESPTFQYFPTTVTQRACTGDLPLDGVRYRIIREATDSIPSKEFDAFPTLQPGTCRYQADVGVEDIEPNSTGPTTYTVQMLINGIRRGEGTMNIHAGN